jgi:hypothetical protein
MRGLCGLLLLAACLPLLLLVGCRAHLIQTSVVNSGTAVLHNIEVDYPSASFGIPSLAPGAIFHYPIQIQDAGRTKIEFFDSAEKPHSGRGPYLTQGQQGTLTIYLDGSGKNQWVMHVHPAATAPPGQ